MLSFDINKHCTSVSSPSLPIRKVLKAIKKQESQPKQMTKMKSEKRLKSSFSSKKESHQPSPRGDKKAITREDEMDRWTALKQDSPSIKRFKVSPKSHQQQS